MKDQTELRHHFARRVPEVIRSLNTFLQPLFQHKRGTHLADKFQMTVTDMTHDSECITENFLLFFQLREFQALVESIKLEISVSW